MFSREFNLISRKPFSYFVTCFNYIVFKILIERDQIFIIYLRIFFKLDCYNIFIYEYIYRL